MEVDQITETLIRIDERTKEIKRDLVVEHTENLQFRADIQNCVKSHDERIRALEIKEAKDHGSNNTGGNNSNTAAAAGLGVGAGIVFAFGKIFGWFKNVW
jgi:hypothetical protein